MSLYSELVIFDWEKLENQPLFVKSQRRENEKQGYSIELAVDRSTSDVRLKGETFKVYGKMIEDYELDTDVKIIVNRELSGFMRSQYENTAYIVVNDMKKVDFGD